MRVLVVKLSALGDILHAMPVVRRAILEGYRVGWMVDMRYAGILDLFPGLEAVHVVDPKGWGRNVRDGKFLHACGKIRSEIAPLRAAQYEVAMDIQGLLKSALLARASGSGRIAGFSRRACREKAASLFYAKKVDVDPLEPVVHQIMKLFSMVLGIVNTPAPPGLVVPDSEVMRASDLLKGEKPVVLVAGAGWQTKLIPEVTMRMVAEEMADYGPIVVLSGNDAERDRALRIIGGIPGARNLHRQELTFLAGVLKMARVVIGPDTGVIHLAAHLGIPTVSIYGPSLGTRSGPIGNEHRWVQSEVDCSPCFKRVCDNFFCMDGISTERIIVNAQALMD